MTTSRSIDFKMKCGSLEKEKVGLIEKSICKGKTIKRLWKEMKHYVSSFHESEAFTEAKEHEPSGGFSRDFGETPDPRCPWAGGY